MCKCFGELIEKVKEHVKPTLPDGATDVSFDWHGAVFYLVEGDFPTISPRVDYSFRGIKKNGDPKANLTKDTLSVKAKYCCFCGRKYEGSAVKAA